MTTHATHPQVPAERMAGYAKLSRTRSLMKLARKADGLAHDLSVLRWTGDVAAAAGAAHMLRDTMLILAGEVANDARELARKANALLPDRIAEAGFDALGAAVIAAAVAAEREGLDADAPRAPLDPTVLAFYEGYLASATFGKAFSEHGGVVHDLAWLVAMGRLKEAERQAVRVELDLVRLASRPASGPLDAALKSALLAPRKGCFPTLAAMLAAAGALEHSGSRLDDLATLSPVMWQDDFPGEEERCAAYARLPDPTDASLYLERAEVHWRNLEALGTRAGPARDGCLLALMDLGLAVAAITARRRDEVERKVAFMADLLNLLGTAQPLAAAMILAALRVECDHWDILVEDRSERAANPSH